MNYMNYASLFELSRPPRVYRSEEEELIAVAERRKAMAMYAPGGPPSDAWYAALAGAAARHGLSVFQMVDEVSGLQTATAYLLYEDMLSRAYAHWTLMRACADGGWTDAVEIRCSSLLGYTHSQIDAWMSYITRKQVAWGVWTVYLLATDRQRSRLEQVGGRCIPSEVLVEPLQVLCPLDTNLVPRREAPGRLRGMNLGRFAAKHEQLASVVDLDFKRAGHRGFHKHVLTAKDYELINQVLHTRVEFLTSEGWRSNALRSPRGSTRAK